MWASGLVSLGIGEGVFVQGSWPTPVINAILSGKRRSILLFHWKLSPQCSCSGIPGGRTGAGKWGEGPLVKHLRSCYWGWGEIGCSSRAQIFLAPHTRALAPLKVIKTQGPCVYSPISQANGFWASSGSLFSNRKRFLKTLFVWRAKPAPC